MGRKEYHGQKRSDKHLLQSCFVVIRPANPGDYPAYERLFAELRIPDPFPPRATFEREVMATTLIAEALVALVALGATLRLETMHLRAPL